MCQSIACTLRIHSKAHFKRKIRKRFFLTKLQQPSFRKRRSKCNLRVITNDRIKITIPTDSPRLHSCDLFNLSPPPRSKTSNKHTLLPIRNVLILSIYAENPSSGTYPITSNITTSQIQSKPLFILQPLIKRYHRRSPSIMQMTQFPSLIFLSLLISGNRFHPIWTSKTQHRPSLQKIEALFQNSSSPFDGRNKNQVPAKEVPSSYQNNH